MTVRTVVGLVALVGFVLVSSARAEDAPASGDEERSSAPSASRYDDTGRFYLLFGTGAVFLLDDKFAGTVHDDSHEFSGTNVNIPENVGIGYNFSKHWGIEVLGVGTEPDIRTDTGKFSQLGKLGEYSNISIFPALRYRYPLGDGRFVPWGLGAVGWSLNAFNDSTTPRIKVKGDGSTIAGTLAMGFDYFLNPDVAVGLSTQALIYPSIDTEVLNKNTGAVMRGSNNLTSMALFLNFRLFPGRKRADGTFTDDDGGFDTAERRYYLFGIAGDHIFFDDSFGGGLKPKAAGSANWTLGGGFGVNLDQHWGVELQLLSNSDINMDDGALGKIGEGGIFHFLPTGRYRWQFWDGRLVPFVTAGVGLATNSPNDPRNVVDVFDKGPRHAPKWDVQKVSVAGSVGIGIEYFLNRHISVGLGLPLVLYPDWSTTVQQRSLNGQNVGQPVHGSWNYTGIFPYLRLAAYFP